MVVIVVSPKSRSKHRVGAAGYVAYMFVHLSG